MAKHSVITLQSAIDQVVVGGAFSFLKLEVLHLDLEVLGFPLGDEPPVVLRILMRTPGPNSGLLFERGQNFELSTQYPTQNLIDWVFNCTQHFVMHLFDECFQVGGWPYKDYRPPTLDKNPGG